MIKREEVNGMVFMAITTYYVYKSREHFEKGRAMLKTASKETFDATLAAAKLAEEKGMPFKFIIHKK